MGFVAWLEVDRSGTEVRGILRYETGTHLDVVTTQFGEEKGTLAFGYLQCEMN